jgi:hypothetical protein
LALPELLTAPCGCELGFEVVFVELLIEPLGLVVVGVC